MEIKTAKKNLADLYLIKEMIAIVMRVTALYKLTRKEDHKPFLTIKDKNLLIKLEHTLLDSK